MSEDLSTPRNWLTERAADLLICLRFCTRLPIPPQRFEPEGETPSLARAIGMLPLAGAAIGALAALVLWLCIKLGLPISLAALVAILTLILLTGALHEDGLADVADGCGGATPEARLAIMKDSRLGTYGSLALAIFVLGRVMSIALLAEHSVGLAAAVLIAAGATSRAAALMPLRLLPPLGAGLGAATSDLKEADLLAAGIAALVLGLLPLVAGAGILRTLFALLAVAAVAYGVTAWARRNLEGQTGDVAGAAQQCGELAAYLVFTTHL